MTRRLSIALGLTLALVVAGPAAGDRRQDIDNRIESLRGKIAEVREREGVLTSEIAVVTNKIRTLQGDVESASNRLAHLESDLAAHEERLEQLTELYRLQTRRFTLLREQHELAQQRLSARLVDIYQSEDPDAVAVVLNAATFQDLVDQLEFIGDIARRDDEIARQVSTAKVAVRKARAATKRTRARVAEATRVIAARTAEQREQRDRLIASRTALASARDEKRDTLSDVRASEEEYIHEVAALEKVSAQLAAQIRVAQSRAASAPTSSPSSSAAAPPAAPTAPPSSSGFVWPASGPVTSTYGWRWGRMHEGIDIAAPSGAPVVASASGTVIYSGWLGGYGNLIVVDHGGGLATAYAHLSGYAVSSGQAVGQGQTVGYVGSTGNSTGPHLHFEVRVNGTAVDPFGYL